jgi:hypothetical protein
VWPLGTEIPVPDIATRRRFTVSPDSGAVIDVASGRLAGCLRLDPDGNWRGAAYLPDGTAYSIGPWATPYAAADAAWLMATAGDPR